MVRENGLIVYLHPGDGHAERLAAALAANPDITFLVHGDQIQYDIGDLMDRFPNVYYTVDALYGDQWLLKPEYDVATFMELTDDFGWMLDKDLGDWKEVIEAHPDRFMWGTDRGGVAVWTLDVDVGRRLVEYARAFIGALDRDVQDLFAYQNAERLAAEAGNDG